MVVWTFSCCLRGSRKLTLVLRVWSTNTRFGSLVLLTLEPETHDNIDEERDDEDS